MIKGFMGYLKIIVIFIICAHQQSTDDSPILNDHSGSC